VAEKTVAGAYIMALSNHMRGRVESKVWSLEEDPPQPNWEEIHGKGCVGQ
jgi:hypothetical protein